MPLLGRRGTGAQHIPMCTQELSWVGSVQDSLWKGSGSPRVSEANPATLNDFPFLGVAPGSALGLLGQGCWSHRGPGVTQGPACPHSTTGTRQGHCSSSGLQTREANTKALKVQVSSSCHRLKLKCPTLNYIQASPNEPLLQQGYHYLAQVETLH